MNDPILPLPGLSPAGGKAVVVKFDGGLLSSDGGVLALREVERRLRVADRLACCPDGRLALIAAKMASRALMPRLRLSRFRDSCSPHDCSPTMSGRFASALSASRVPKSTYSIGYRLGSLGDDEGRNHSRRPQHGTKRGARGARPRPSSWLT